MGESLPSEFWMAQQLVSSTVACHAVRQSYQPSFLMCLNFLLTPDVSAPVTFAIYLSISLV